jgi:hypothetical protein
VYAASCIQKNVNRVSPISGDTCMDVFFWIRIRKKILEFGAERAEEMGCSCLRLKRGALKLKGRSHI